MNFLFCETIRGTLFPLNVQVLDARCMCLDKVLARQHLVTHEHVEGAVGFGGVIDRHREQGPRIRVHGGLP